MTLATVPMNNLPRGDVINTISSGAARRVPFGQRVDDERANTSLGETAEIEENGSWDRTGSGMAGATGGGYLPGGGATHAIEKGRAVASEAQCHVAILYEQPLLDEGITPMEPGQEDIHRPGGTT